MGLGLGSVRMGVEAVLFYIAQLFVFFGLDQRTLHDRKIASFVFERHPDG